MTQDNKPIAYTLFCDDIRYERDHKYSALGVYQTALVLNCDELELPKFVALTVVEVPSSAIGRAGFIRLMDGEEVLIEGGFTVPGPPEGNNVPHQLLASMPIEAVPFAAKVGMSLQVQFSVGEFKYVSPVLRVVRSGEVASVEMEGTSVGQPPKV